MQPHRHEVFPLFKGATRVPTLWGVPMIPLMVMVMSVAVIALIVSIWWWGLLPPLWFLMAQITKNDDKAFRIWWLWIDTKLRNRNTAFWGASSYTPAPCRRRR
jgi:type IV secretion system protein VirB3